jgi:hypothetical protein
MIPAEFEATIPAFERSQTYTLDLATTGIGKVYLLRLLILKSWPLKKFIQLMSLHVLSGFKENNMPATFHLECSVIDSF